MEEHKEFVLTARSDQALLDKYGLKANDAILADPEKHMGLYEDLIQNYNAVLIAGGAAQNTARGAAYILEPNSVVYIGCIGKDKYGETLEKISADAGVKTEYLYDEKTPTGRCGVVITGHNRSLCTDLAAANNYKLEHLKQDRIWKQVENAKVFYVGGFHLTVCVPAIKALAEEAASKNKVRDMLLVCMIIRPNTDLISAIYSQPLRTFYLTVFQGPS